MAGNGPMNRKKNITGSASDSSMQTHGAGRQTGPVGNREGYEQRREQQARPGSASRPQRSGGTPTRGGGGMGKLILIVLAVVLLSGGGGLSGLFGGGNQGDTTGGSQGGGSLVGSLLGNDGGNGASSLISGGLSSLLSGYSSSALQDMLGGSWFSSQTGIGSTASPASGAAAANAGGANYTALDRTVAAGSRARYTALRGNGRDTVTVLVYMCGADLESKSAMATRDLQEMLAAKFSGNVRLIVYTGGSTGWRNNLVSSSVNQIWQIADGQMICLEKNAGSGAMTSPDTLADFIRYGAKNFPADRCALILWDHGSGSVSGYGYDERNPRAGSMSLAGIDTALKNGGLKFDFIGFDTCLMATVENALMASRYADYLIASEETEPGIGWYYTDWLTALGANTSMDTLEIGKRICDDFVTKCASECRGQMTTLSVIDLAELEHTVPGRLSAFANGVTRMVTEQNYKAVSNARNGSREFAVSARIDQVDLTDLCNNLGTEESAALAKALRAAVKYNRTNIADAYGLSVYFPYQRTARVDQAVNTYAAIGLDDSYSQAIRAFASVEAGGQAVSGSAGSPLYSLFGAASGGGSSADMIGSLLSSFLGGGGDFLSGRTMSDEQLGQYLTANRLDAAALAFRREGNDWVLDLAPDQWALVHGVDLNLFYDNGAGYVDLGLDNLFEFDGQGRLVADTSGTWLAINGQPVAYYHETSQQIDDVQWRITGRVPALLNGDRVDLLIVFDQDHESGYVAGARSVYVNGETETVAKNITGIGTGDTLVFLADLYDYSQRFTDSYEFGSPITVSGELTVSDVYLPDASKALATYRFTDIYNQAYWTPVIGR